MTRVSKNRLFKDYEERIKELIIETFAKLNSKKCMANFYEEFFTRTEKIMFAKRLAIGVLLLKGWSFVQICHILKVSMGTVNNVNFWVTHHSGEFRKQIENIIKNEKNEKAWKDFWYDLGKALTHKTTVNWGKSTNFHEIQKRKHARLI